MKKNIEKFVFTLTGPHKRLPDDLNQRKKHFIYSAVI
jgi:hypothetical protein